MAKIHFREITGRGPGYYGLLTLFAALTAMGLAAALYMEIRGHIVTGMNNQIVWGLPHVFAVFLIVSASGALNVASMASVFGRSEYKPLARLSALLAIALLVGGLTILVLDLGRPDRLIVAMTHYNFRSIFAWNIFLYTGFIAVVAAYLWSLTVRADQPRTRAIGWFAFLWRVILTTGTGSIFGFLVARDAYDEAVMAPLFVAMSLSYGLAIFTLVLMAMFRGSRRALGDGMLARLRRLQALLAGGVLYFLLAYHLTKLYAEKHRGVEHFLLVSGGLYPLLFWLGVVGLGGVAPLLSAYAPWCAQRRGSSIASAAAVIAGGIALVYVIIIGGQAYPLQIFPGMQVSSPFSDGVINSYRPSVPELALALGGVALSLLLVMLAVKFFRILPEHLKDREAEGGPDGQTLGSPQAAGH